MRGWQSFLLALPVALPLLAGGEPKAAPAGATPATPGFEGVKALARDLASRPYVDHRQPLSHHLREMDYEAQRLVTFDERKSVWRRERLPFQIQFFHPGGPSNDQMDFRIVDGDDTSDVPFSKDYFNYDEKAHIGWLDLRGVKFAGFRVLYPINGPDRLDEFIVFRGASYFRAVPEGMVYGLSARALAVNCGEPGPEEFPLFREFWVDRPDRKGQVLKFRGLLDSASLAGVAEFTVEPGRDTVAHVRLAIFPRVDVPHCGIAPLTSMYWFGKNSQRHFDDPRPEVHDSDGLLVQTRTDEWLWRPLDNTGKLRLSAFADAAPKGFGLMQRERDPSCYQDLHAQYQRRPCAWVRPGGDWGAGTVRLVEIPTETEFSDNIVAFWEPQQPLRAGQPAEFSYDLIWCGDKPELPALGRVIATRTGAVPGVARARRFMLDFSWTALEQQGAALQPEILATALHGQLQNRKDEYNPYQRTWRVMFDVTAEDGADAVELRVRVRKARAACTETWTYCWNP
jgi:periplasmic glucans biosynthesis protein